MSKNEGFCLGLCISNVGIWWSARIYPVESSHDDFYHQSRSIKLHQAVLVVVWTVEQEALSTSGLSSYLVSYPVILSWSICVLVCFSWLLDYSRVWKKCTPFLKISTLEFYFIFTSNKALWSFLIFFPSIFFSKINKRTPMFIPESRVGVF